MKTERQVDVVRAMRSGRAIGGDGVGRCGGRERHPALAGARWALCTAALLLAACGDDSETSDDATATSSGAGSTATSSGATTPSTTAAVGSTSSSSGAGGEGVGGAGTGGAGGAGSGGAGGTGPDLGALTLVPVDGDFSLPIYGAPGGPGEIFVADKSGLILRVVDGVLEDAPLLDITHDVPDPEPGAEEGLLSFALAPDFDSSGLLYVLVADTRTDDIIVTEYQRVDDEETIDPDTAREVMSFPIVPGNHIGGAITFGPDGYLYIAMGDQTSAQDLSAKFGKILRIDVDTWPEPVPGNLTGDDVDPDIFHAGFHNPWRISFDRETDLLYIADVGLLPPFEEVNRYDVDDGPADFGYPSMSGFECLDEPCDDYQAPILAYPHDESRCAIMGGYVYRGSAIPALVGRYVFADLCTGELFSMAADAASPAPLQPITPTYLPLDEVPPNPISFIEDSDGELWVMGVQGPVAKLEPAE